MAPGFCFEPSDLNLLLFLFAALLPHVAVLFFRFLVWDMML